MKELIRRRKYWPLVEALDSSCSPHTIPICHMRFTLLASSPFDCRPPLVFSHRLINCVHIYFIQVSVCFACRTHNRTEKSTYAYRCVMRSSPPTSPSFSTRPYGRVQPVERRFRRLLAVRRCSSSTLTRRRRQRAKNTRLALVLKPTRVRVTSVMQESGACLHVAVDLCSSMKAESVDQAMS